MPGVDISLVTFRPEIALLRELLRSLAETPRGDLALTLLVEDNSPEPVATGQIGALIDAMPGNFARVDVHRSGKNLGFGRGHNANAKRGTAPFLLVINQDCILEPGALATLLATALADDENVAAWEMRQIPYEHPKAYDPASLETPWVSGAATLFRRTAYEAVRGFDEAIFMYGEDVDLSWRLRARGLRLRYVPRAAVVHRAYRVAAEVKPLQIFGGVQTNLGLRMRYAGPARIVQGFSMLGAQILSPRSFPGRRRGLALAGVKALMSAPHFLASRVPPTSAFRPHFDGWDYETRRDGAFHEFPSRRERPLIGAPLVSILIRTVSRPAWLRHALASCANQTYPRIEAVVVEDGPATSQSVVDEFRGRLEVRYHATGRKAGRARAGNLALADARGEWLNFLDDDDVLFADHVEVLVDAARDAGVAGAFGLAWETHTVVIDRDLAAYEETLHATRHRHPFDRLALWHHNFLPIQAVLFHRRLYERYGGFAEDMEQLEDWNLWTRYTLEDDFTLVAKTTSKYRVPADSRVAIERQALLDAAYRDARARQDAMQVTMSPRAISEMAENYARSQAVMLVTRDDLRRFVHRVPWLARAAAWRRPMMNALRRRVPRA
jgi:GT2 family glycosyltransferase